MSGEPRIENPHEPQDTDLPFCRDSCPALAAAWERSLRTLADVRRRLDSVADLPGLETVAVAGSLGRNEQTAASDLDLIVVTERGDDEETAIRIRRSIWGRLETAEFQPPQADGIFARPISSAALCDPETLGVVDEDMAAFGLRMQLLLEGRSVCRDGCFTALLRRILLRFLPCGAGREAENPWRPLLDDLLRYHRSLCGRYRAALHTGPALRCELQLKAGYGRLANVVGLLVVLGDSLAETDAPAAVLRGCRHTPLQRIAASYARHGDAGFDRVCALYEPFVAAFGDVAFRGRLTAAAECDAATAAMRKRLNANALDLKRELSGFLFERIRRRDWPPQFCDDLLL